MTIYSYNIEKMEISAKETYLRITKYKNDGKKKYEYIYKRENDPTQIREIEERSVRWELRGADRSKKYYVEIQFDAEKKLTGNIRIVSRECAKIEGAFSKKLVVDKEKYVYYVRRKNNAI